ncbi:MAG: hypothetical protein AB7U05_09015 [Mangrovibacterium sp.]
MILKTTTTDGRTRYFDAFSGREVHMDRVCGRGTSRLPDIAAFYLTPGPSRRQSPASAQPFTTKSIRRELTPKFKAAAAKRKPLTWWQKLVNRIKKLF